MAFSDSFTDTAGTQLGSRTGWTLVTDGAIGCEISDTGDAITFRNTGGGSGKSLWTCTAQGADSYVQVTDVHFTAQIENFLALRIVDVSNFCGWRLTGIGSSGSKLTKCISGTYTNLVSFQGATSDVYKVTANGTTYQIFKNGSQQGTDQTISNADLSTSTDAQGFIGGTLSGGTTSDRDDFSAASLGGGGTTVIKLAGEGGLAGLGGLAGRHGGLAG